MAITAGAGTNIAADELTINGVAVKVQRVKQVLGRDGTFTADLAGRDLGSGDGAQYVDQRDSVVRVAQTPTISNGAIYAAKDAVGGLLTFANAARVAGFPIYLEALQIVDKGQQMAALDLVLFDRTLTAPTDNAIFAPTDAELATCVGVIEIPAADYNDFSTNSVASSNDAKLAGGGMRIVLSGTSLFGVLVSRGTPTYTSTADLVVTATIKQS